VPALRPELPCSDELAVELLANATTGHARLIVTPRGFFAIGYSRGYPRRDGLMAASKSNSVANVVAICALVVSAVGLGISYLQSQRALEISSESLDYARSQSPTLDLDTEVYGSWVTSAQPPDSLELQVTFALQNTGEEQLRGCSTKWGYTEADGTPIMFYASVVEPGGEVWTLGSGENHETSVKVSAKRQYEIGDTAFIATWFECQSPAIVTSRRLFGVDLSTGALTNGAIYGLKVLEPMSSVERAILLDERYGRESPWNESTIPPYVVAPDDN
jgi:hypothetical protein